MRPALVAPALIALALVAVVPAARAQTVPRDRGMALHVEAGHELRVRNYAAWNRGCTPNGVPQVAVRTQPAHGTLSIRPATATIREVREGVSTGCVGTQVPGVAVSCTPAAGFRGTDRFDYDVIGSTAAHDTVTVEVR